MSDKKKETLLMTEGSIPRHLIKFAIPLIVGNFFQQTYQLVDMIIVGRCINDGGVAIAAVGVGSTFIIMTIGLFSGIAGGAGIVVANAYGAGRMNRVQKSIVLALRIAVILSITAAAGFILLCDWLLDLINATEEIIPMASLYLKIYAVGFIPTLIYNMGAAILQAMGNSRSPFYYLAVACVLNIGLDILFMGTLGMGVSGAALATVLAQVASMVLVLRKIYAFNQFKSVNNEEDAEDGLAARIIRFGVPMGIQTVALGISNMIIQGHFNQLGTDVIAAWSIFSKIDGYIILPLLSFSTAITNFTGQNYGAGKLERIRNGKNWVSIMSVGTTILLCLVFLPICRSVTELFGASVSVVDAVWELALYMFPGYVILSLMRVYTGLFNGMGKTMVASVTMIFFVCVVRAVCVSLTFPLLQSMKAIYLTYYVSWAACLIALILLYHLLIRKQLVGKKK